MDETGTLRPALFRSGTRTSLAPHISFSSPEAQHDEYDPPNTKHIRLAKVGEGKALSLAPEVPNAATRAAMIEARAMGHARFVSLNALIDDIEKD